MDTSSELDRIRINNIISILNVFRLNKETSISVISDKTGIGVTTVKKYIEQGIDNGMLINGGLAPSTGGRNARKYSLNSEYGYYLCFILDNNDLHYYVVDFSLNTVSQNSVVIKLTDYLSTVENITAEIKNKFSSIKAVCLSLPCIVKDGKIIDWYYNSSLNGFNIEKLLSEKFNVNVIVQNDMKLAAFSRSFKEEKAEPTIATVQFGHNGIGVAEMISGKIHEGNIGFAGEVGFLKGLNKSITDISFPAKIINALIVFINPEKIIFYNSNRQNEFDKIFKTAVSNIPQYAIPDYIVVDAYLPDILDGLLKSAELEVVI